MDELVLLYGVADRGDLVAMFFNEDGEDLAAFRESLPGRYQVMEIDGVDYDRLVIKSIDGHDLDDDNDDCWDDLEGVS